MASPLATEKVLRGTLQALQRGGLLGSGSDVAALEQIPNNATDVTISAILDSMVFGGVSVSSNIVSDEDINVFIDADNNDSPVLTPRYFRVSQDQAIVPVTEQSNELMTVADLPLPWSITDHVPTLTVGPDRSIVTTTQDALIRIGATPTDHFGLLLGASNALLGGLSGLSIRSSDRMDFRCDKHIMVGDTVGYYCRGGWATPASVAQFHVGDFLASPGQSLIIEAEDVLGGGHADFTFRPSYDDAVVRRFYFRGSNAANNYYSHTIVGGKGDEAWAKVSDYNSPTFLVIGDDSNRTANAAYFYDRKTTRNADTEVVTIKSAAVGAGLFYLLRVINNLGTAVFSVDSDGHTNGPFGFTTGPADVAELVIADQEYDPGTVLAIQNGIYTHTETHAQQSVAGVVTETSGLLLGKKNSHDCSQEFRFQPDVTQSTRQLHVSGVAADQVGDFIRVGTHRFIEIDYTTDEQDGCLVRLTEELDVRPDSEIWGGITKTANLNRMAICGIVPVMCSTERGEILGNGETLVSGPDGTAVVDLDPKPGTIIGKAKGRLTQPGNTVVKGLVETLVNLQ